MEVRTRDAISKMSKLAHFHAERQFVKKSRVTEFLRLADMAHASTLDEAHKIFFLICLDLMAFSILNSQENHRIEMTEPFGTLSPTKWMLRTG